VAVEAGVGGWEPTHLEAVGYGSAVAASATSAYWLMMTVGRFLVAPLTLRWPESAIITVGCTGMAVCLLAAVVPGLAPYAYAGVGLFIAPIFPTGLPWLNRAVPAARRAGALVIAASMVGGVAAGPVLGRAIELSGVRTVPLLLCLLAAVCLAATRWLSRATRRTVHGGVHGLCTTVPNSVTLRS
jgi:fucose permease